MGLAKRIWNALRSSPLDGDLEQELARNRALLEEEELREDHQLGKSRLTERGSLTSCVF